MDLASRGRTVTRPMRGLLGVFALLAALATSQLYVLSEHTARYFAWTIQPPITAAFLGGGFGAGVVLVVLAFRERTWATVRISITTILVFVLVTLAATVLHLDRFHFGEAEALPRFSAWLWTVTYVVVPVVMAALMIQHVRMVGRDPRRLRPLPWWLWGMLGIQGLVMVAAGLVLFAVPPVAGRFWPWMLTPLTARAVSAWALALGFAAFQALRENDLIRLRIAAVTYLVFGLLQLAALARFFGQVVTGPALWGYVGVLLSICVVGLYGAVAGSPRHAYGRRA